MYPSLALLPALAAAVYAQGTVVTPPTAAPQTLTSSIPQGNCNQCFIIANVAQVIFADFTLTATASAIVSASTGRNGTVVTTTLMQPAQAFSADPNGLISGSAVAVSYVPISGTLLTLNGATLTSPTAYNVFTAFTSFTQSLNAAGICTTSAGTTSVLNSAISFEILPNAPSSQIIAAESQFVAQIGGVSCLPGGVVISSTVPVMQTTTTVTSSTSAPARPSSLPESSAAATTSTSTTISSSSIAATTNGTSSAAATSTSIVMLTPTPTIILGAGSTVHPRVFSASLVAAILVIPGIAAWML